MASDETQSGFNSIMQQRASMGIWSCLRILSIQGSNREGTEIVKSFQAHMDFESELTDHALAS